MGDVELTKAEAERQGKEYSRKVLEEYDTLWGDAHWDYVRRFRARWMLAKIASAEPGIGGIRALEAGCGIGFTTFETAASGLVASVRAVDMASEALKVARKLQYEGDGPEAEKIVFEEANFFELEERGEYDCVYMHEVFEHVQSGEAVFEKAFKLLRPGGYFMISTPNYDRALNRMLSMAGKQRSLIDPYHIKEYTLGELMERGPGWSVAASTGRQLVDETAMGILFALGIKRLYGAVAPLARLVCRSRLMYHAGALFPRVSTELLVLYKRN